MYRGTVSAGCVLTLEGVDDGTGRHGGLVVVDEVREGWCGQREGAPVREDSEKMADRVPVSFSSSD